MVFTSAVPLAELTGRRGAAARPGSRAAWWSSCRRRTARSASRWSSALLGAKLGPRRRRAGGLPRRRGRPNRSARCRRCVQRVLNAAEAQGMPSPTVALAREVLEGAAAAAAAGAAPRRSSGIGGAGRRRLAEPGEDGLGVARRRRPPHRGVALMAIKGSLKEASLPGRHPAAVPRAADRLPGARRPPQLRHDLLRRRPDHLRLDRQPAGPAGRHPGPERPDHGRAAPAGDRRRRTATGEHKLGEILVELGALTRAGAGGLHPPPDRGGGLLPVHLDVRAPSTSRPASGPSARTSSSASTPSRCCSRARAGWTSGASSRRRSPRFDLIFAVDQAHIRPVGVRAVGASSSGCCRCSTARRDVQQVVDESGLVEFEVGKALYGLITAGFAHRVGHLRRAAVAEGERRPGRGAPQPRHRLLQGRHARRGRCASSAASPSCGPPRAARRSTSG